jgi:CheY-like chemotaxis protein
VALAIHELVTNAAKYGALSTPQGKVALEWRLEDGQLIVQWTEMGGPPVKAPTTEGFGSTMIRANVEGTLDGSIQFDWRAQGLHCVIIMPQTNLVHGREKRALAALMATRPVETPRASSKIRILLVEDEALVALAMQETLNDLGYQVVGPFARNSDAMEIIGREHIDGAVLDLNVGGEPVYPVADALADRHVPYLLVTGYGTESIDDRYRSAPTLQKPVESQSLANLLKVMFKVYAPMRSQAAQQATP